MYGIDLSASQRMNSLLDDIEQNFRIILTTRKGDKIGDPEFGCAGWSQLDRSMPEIAGIVADVVKALNRDEPRAKVQSVTPDFSLAASGQARLSIRYRIIGTGQIVDTSIAF